jgi:ATP-dependent DNA helicase
MRRKIGSVASTPASPAKKTKLSAVTTTDISSASKNKSTRKARTSSKKKSKEDDAFEFDEETRAIYGDDVTQSMIDENEKAAKAFKKSLDNDEDWQAFEKKKQVFHRTLTYAEKKEKLEDLLRKAEAYSQFLAQRHNEYVNDETNASEHRFTQPKNMTGGSENLKLRPYQESGAAWLEGLNFNGLHGILADEMGLGKTIQVIAVIAHLMLQGVKGPFLIVAPLSTLRNWESEFSRWCPNINKLVYHGSRDDREDMRKQFMKLTKTKSGRSHRVNGRDAQIEDDFPVIITSYDIAMIDSKHLANFTWKYLVVDEGHRLKNKDCRLMKELKRIPSQQRVLLTGTPLQNNLSELWSLLNFLMPDAFDDLQFFQAWFGWDSKNRNMTETIKQDNDGEDIIRKLHTILNPFMMRRLKKDVAKYLPEKKEIIVYAGMTDDQRAMYRAIEQDLSTFQSQMKMVKKAEGKTYKSLLNRVMQMRKCCNHPYLINDVEETTEHLVESSGKLKLLDRMLRHFFKHGHKVLIFSQFTSMLDIIEDFLILRGWHDRCCRIDGSVKLNERQDQIEAFNEEDSEKNIFLLSTRAGGVGINLASADTVIIYDSDWNPHMDNQAQDRAHRIGQKKDVFVYRMCMESSVETLVLERANAKRSLSRMTMSGNFSSSKNVSKSSLGKEIIEKLLEDDVKMNETLLKGTEGGISDKELNMILDRDLVMGKKKMKVKGKKVNIPWDGKGYQIVEHKAESLVGSSTHTGNKMKQSP